MAQNIPSARRSSYQVSRTWWASTPGGVFHCHKSARAVPPPLGRPGVSLWPPTGAHGEFGAQTFVGLMVPCRGCLPHTSLGTVQTIVPETLSFGLPACWLLVVGACRWLLVVGGWWLLVVAAYWLLLLLIGGCCLLVVAAYWLLLLIGGCGWWLLVAGGYWLLVVGAF